MMRTRMKTKFPLNSQRSGAGEQTPGETPGEEVLEDECMEMDREELYREKLFCWYYY